MKKFLKKVAAFLLTIVMLGCLIVSTTLLVFKDTMSPKNLSAMINSLDNNSKEELISGMLKEMKDDEEIGGVVKHLDEEEFSDTLIEYVVDLLDYSSTDSGKKPDSSKLEEVVINAAEEYNKENEGAIDIEKIKKGFDELDDSVDEVGEDIFEDESAKKVMALAYGSAFVTPLVIFVICLLLMFLLDRDFKPCLKNTGIAFIITSIFMFILSKLIVTIISSEKELAGLGNIFGGIFNKYAIIYIVISIILFAINIFLHNKNKNQTIKNKD